MRKLPILLTLVNLFMTQQLSAIARTPRVTIIAVIDHLGYHDFINSSSTFNGGLKFLHDKGISYTNVTVPLGLPSIAPSYATISTGALPHDHGIVDNSWLDQSYQLIHADDDQCQGAVFSSHPKPIGKSAHYLAVDTLADQLALSSSSRFTVYALARDSAPAILLAGRQGKPFWLDPQEKAFTTSRAFCTQLPPWLSSWNKQTHIETVLETSKPEILDGHQSDVLLIDLAYTCLSQHLSSEPSKNLVLWLGFNGAQSARRLQQLDTLLTKFIRAVYRKVNAQDALFVLTSGQAAPCQQEKLQNESFSLAQKMSTGELTDALNRFVYQRYGIAPCLIKKCTGVSVYLDQALLSSVDTIVKRALWEDLKKFLRTQAGIQDAWTLDELIKLPVESTNVRSYLKNQAYPGRSGDLIYLVRPYMLITHQDHVYQTPYAYDTHVPLILYQQGVLENKRVHQPTFIQQLAPTLASILDVPRPSAAGSILLPELYAPNPALP